MARDPRWNPLPGDTLVQGKPRGLLERVVLSVQDNRVTFTAKGRSHTTSLTSWRFWSTNAKIAKYAMNTT